MWKEIWKEEEDNHFKRKQPVKRAEVWQEEDPKKEILEDVFEDGDDLYKDVNKHDGFSLGV